MKSGDALDDRVRRKLVTSLYTQPSSLILGALCGIGSASAVAYYTGNLFFICAAVVLSAIGVLRAATAMQLTPDVDGPDTKHLEMLYELGAFSYAFVVGLIAAATIALDLIPGLQLLMVSYAIAYGTGISARNAGRPMIAIGQLFLALLPLIIVCALQGDLVHGIMAVTSLLLLPAMVSITFNVFDVLRESIAAAETSQHMADKMRHLARTDVVTGLSNRAGLNHEMVEKLMAMADHERLALFWLDLDKFKEVNDTLGHPVGDRVLVRSRPAPARIPRRRTPPWPASAATNSSWPAKSTSRAESRTPGCPLAGRYLAPDPDRRRDGSTSAPRWASLCCPTTAPISTP